MFEFRWFPLLMFLAILSGPFVIWYRSGWAINVNYDLQNSEIASFLNGTANNSYESIKIISNIDISPLHDTIKDVCEVDLEVISSEDFIKVENNSVYIKIEKLSFDEPYLEYKLVKITV